MRYLNLSICRLRRMHHVWGVLLLFAIVVGVLPNERTCLGQLIADSAQAQEWARCESLLDHTDKDPGLLRAQADGTTALHWAVFYDQSELVKRLVKAGADVDASNLYGVTPLSLACELGHDDSGITLIENGADVEKSRLGGERPLMLAARQGSLRLVEALIKAGANVDAKEVKGQTALMWAAAAGNLKATRLLVDAKADLQYNLKSGFDPLMFAVQYGRTNVALFLIEHGFDVNQVLEPQKTGGRHPRKRMSPLMIAIESGHLETAIRLVEKGADPNDQRSGFAPLHAITWVRRTNRGDNPAGDPAPRITGVVNSLEFTQRLIELGADPGLALKNGRQPGKAQLNTKGATPFLLASQTCDLPLMKLLLEHGANPNVANEDGCTPLMAAAGIGVVAVGEYPGTEEEVCTVVRFLARLGLSVNAVDRNKETAMHGAAYRSFPSAVEMLAELGADPNVWNQKNVYGWTPQAIASGKRPGSVKPSPETMAALKQALQISNADSRIGQ